MTTPNLRQLLAASLATLLVGAVVPAARSAEPRLAHAVYFTLKDQSEKSQKEFVATCEKYLDKHPGAVSFTVGTVAKDVKEPVSDHDFDVALHVVFEDKTMLAKYLKSERHDEFVAEIKDKIAKVRVFDSYVPVAKPATAAK